MSFHTAGSCRCMSCRHSLLHRTLYKKTLCILKYINTYFEEYPMMQSELSVRPFMTGNTLLCHFCVVQNVIMLIGIGNTKIILKKMLVILKRMIQYYYNILEKHITVWNLSSNVYYGVRYLETDVFCKYVANNYLFVASFEFLENIFENIFKNIVNSILT